MHSWSTLSGRISARVARGRHDYRGNSRGLSRSRTRRYPGCTGLRRASRPYQPSRAAQRVKFLVDAQLPSRFGRWLHERGHDALHTLETPGGNRTPDLEIVALAARKGRIVVTKDSDFVQSFLLPGQPSLLFVSTGNIGNPELEIFIAAKFTSDRKRIPQPQVRRD